MSGETDGSAEPGPTPEDLKDLEQVYKDFHQHPELSMQEHRTSGIVAERIKELGYEVTEGVGGTGVVGVLENGDGPIVMCRADMDALPVKEDTGLPYSSNATGTDPDGNEVSVMHACGHDMHTTWLLGAAKVMIDNRDWSGTLITLFQPGEETTKGAQAMIDDHLLERFPKPDLIIGQHVAPPPAGVVTYRPGPTMAADDSFDVRLFGRGGHGSMPDHCIDPIVMAAATVMRMQDIVSREISPAEQAVLTIGSVTAGTKYNVIPDEALLKVNVRTFDDNTRTKIKEAITRIAEAESQASNAPKPPEITQAECAPVTVNDAGWTARLAEAFTARFGADRVAEMPSPATGSEDFGSFGIAWGVPSVFWFAGGTDPVRYATAAKAGTVDQDIPTNHSPNFAPVIHPTLEIGIQAMVTAARRGLTGDKG